MEDSYKHINLEYLYQIADGENEFIIEMISDYISQIPPQFVELQATIAEGDLKRAGFIAHKMKSSFQFMGVASMVEAAGTIELLCSENNTEKIMQQVELMKPVVNQVLDELNHKLSTLR